MSVCVLFQTTDETVLKNDTSFYSEAQKDFVVILFVLVLFCEMCQPYRVMLSHTEPSPKCLITHA